MTVLIDYLRSLQMLPDFGAQMLDGLDIESMKASPHFAGWSKVAKTAMANASATADESASEEASVPCEEKEKRKRTQGLGQKH